MSKRMKITPKQHGSALTKHIRTVIKAMEKFNRISENPDTSKEERDAAALDAVDQIRKARNEFEKIDTAYKKQKNSN